LRLAKQQKAEFTDVNEHFCCKRNEKIDVFLQTLNKIANENKSAYRDKNMVHHKPKEEKN